MAWTPEQDKELLRLRAEGKSLRELGLHFGKAKSRAGDRLNCLAKMATHGPAAERTQDVTDELVADRVLTLDDLLAVTKVDLDKYEVERFVVNKYEVGAKIPEFVEHPTSGDFVSQDKMVVTPLWQVKAWFKAKPRLVQTMQELGKQILRDIRAEAVTLLPACFPQERAKYLFEYSPFDLHLGKLAWGEETVASYDVQIAEDLFNASLDFLLEKALRLSGGSLDRILCVFGNDAMHVDSKKGETTAGTHMDFDSRYIKVYRRLLKIHTRAVNILRTVAPVDVVIVSGNHDELTAFHMGEILATRFEGVPGVTVNNGPRPRKYYEYGVNLFGFTHGDSERISELPLAMAREVPDMWARCPSREWHIGHLHKSDEWQDRKKPMMLSDLTSDKGIRIRRLTSLSGHDAWHTKHAYMDRRACEGFLFHHSAGFTDHMSFNVDHFTGKALSI